MSKNIGEINDSPEDILKNIFENIEETVLYYQKKLNEKNEEINKIKLYKEFVESNKTLNTEYVVENNKKWWWRVTNSNDL